MDLSHFFQSQFDHHRQTVEATRAAVEEPFTRLVEACLQAIGRGNKIMFFGNGGSASDSQHLATELVVRFKKNRDPMAAMALTTDTSALTAIGNDFGFDDLFVRQLHALGREGDVAIGISTSGNSENVIRALKKAREIGITPAAFGGRDGGRMTDLADPFLVVPAEDTARIQEMHILLGHMLCDVLEQEL